MVQNQPEIRVTRRRALDSLGRRVDYPYPPRRIISLCPSQTETLLALGLQDHVVGRTRYCIHPQPTVEAIAEIGGTKQLRMDAIRGLAPDLVIAEKEENRREDVLALEREFPVYVTDVRDVTGALVMIRSLGELCDRDNAARRMADEISRRWQQLRPMPQSLKVAYLIWRKPWMVAGSDTYIDDVLRRCGLVNVFGNHAGRYPDTTLEEITALAPEVVLLSSEPYPFMHEHLQEFASLLPRSKVLLVDGEAFSWYGVHMLRAADELQKLIDLLSS